MTTTTTKRRRWKFSHLFVRVGRPTCVYQVPGLNLVSNGWDFMKLGKLHIYSTVFLSTQITPWVHSGSDLSPPRPDLEFKGVVKRETASS